MTQDGRKSRARGEQGRGAGATLLHLPCLLGIRYLLTHLEPLVHPKHTPAKVTLETTVGSGSRPPNPDPRARYSFAEAVPQVDLTSSSLIREKDSPRPALPRRRLEEKVGPEDRGGGGDTEPTYLQICLGLPRWLNIPLTEAQLPNVIRPRGKNCHLQVKGTVS